VIGFLKLTPRNEDEILKQMFEVLEKNILNNFDKVSVENEQILSINLNCRLYNQLSLQVVDYNSGQLHLD
jgi:hypothetical protein